MVGGEAAPLDGLGSGAAMVALREEVERVRLEEEDGEHLVARHLAFDVVAEDRSANLRQKREIVYKRKWGGNRRGGFFLDPSSRPS